jgi:hypothetical protein
MDPEPTSIDSLDYLVEVCDDANQPDQQTPEVILFPPTPPVLNPPPLPNPEPDRTPRS